MIIELAIFTLIPIFSFAVAAHIVDEDQRRKIKRENGN